MIKNNKSLKKEILQVLILFSILISISIGIVSTISLFINKKESVEHNQKQVLLQVETEVNKFLEDINILSKYFIKNYEFQNNIMKNIVDTNKNISSILILNKLGKIEDFYAISNLNIYKGFDYSKQDYFKELKDNSNGYWSNVFLSTVDEEPSVSFSFKLEDKTIVMMIKLKELSGFIQRFRNKDDSHMIKIFDKTGILILNPDNESLVLQRINAKNSSVFTDVIDKLNPYEFTVFKGLAYGKKEYGTFVTIKQTGWNIIIRESYDLMLQSLNNIILGTIFIIIAFILASVFISFKISKTVSLSINGLETTTTNIANGSDETNIYNTNYVEFNNLLKSFNFMKVEIDKREETLEASLNSFKSLFNSTMEVMVLHNRGICTDANTVAIKFLGLNNKKELIGKNLLKFVSPEYRKLLIQNYWKNTLPYEFDLLINNKKITCLGQGKFIKLNKKRLKLSTLIDITELKDKDNLLFQQSKMAAMGEMIGNIAHQWRQPLNVISTCSSGIKFEKEIAGEIDTNLFETLDMITDNTKYLSKTIDDFRNFFKTDKYMEDFYIEDNINKCLKLLKSNIENNNIKVVATFEKGLSVKGYPNEFLQVIINILNNAKDTLLLNQSAIRYIDINTYSTKKYCVIEIKDNGGGIAESIIYSIFDPYFTTKHKSQGTGIGLYLSHQIIVDHMKGKLFAQNITIKYENIEFKGASFIIKIPKEENNYISEYDI